MNRLFIIAEELGRIAHQRFDLRQAIARHESFITSRKRALIPEGGWPGKNADERKAAEIAAFAGDVELLGAQAFLAHDQDALDQWDVEREVLQAELAAWQWTIRDLEQTGRSVFSLMHDHLSQLAQDAAMTELPF
jgi:hypothetical protein